MSEGDRATARFGATLAAAAGTMLLSAVLLAYAVLRLRADPWPSPPSRGAGAAGVALAIVASLALARGWTRVAPLLALGAAAGVAGAAMGAGGVLRVIAGVDLVFMAAGVAGAARGGAGEVAWHFAACAWAVSFAAGWVA